MPLIGRRSSDTRSVDRCVVFLHIPRTAGTTLSTTLMRNFAERETINLDTLDRPVDKELERIPIEIRSRARLLWGHMPYGVHRHIPGGCEYITILREPTARVVSLYNFILRKPQHVLHDRVMLSGMTLEAFIESGIDRDQTENSQTRQLSGKQFGVVGPEDLADAKRHLKGFLLCGLTERFEESFVLLRRALRLRLPIYATRNVSPPLHPSERARGLVRERNAFDLELFEYASQLFSEQLARQNRSFDAEVSILRALRPVSRLASRRGHGLVHKFSQARAGLPPERDP